MALEALKEYLALRCLEQSSDSVFVRDGMPLKKNFLAARIKAIGRQADVCVSPHRLRHTFATQLLNVDCKVTSIQKLLGHTDLNTTMTYACAFDQAVMLDYFQAINVIESQPGGSWHELSEVNGCVIEESKRLRDSTQSLLVLIRRIETRIIVINA